MRLAQCISEAHPSELEDLATFLAAEMAMESSDVAPGQMIDVDPKDLGKAMAAWAFMRTNERDDE